MATSRYILLFSLIISSVYAKHEQYDGHSLYEVTVNDVEQVKFLHELENVLPIDVWTIAAPGRTGQILAAGDIQGYLQKELSAAGIEYQIVVDNIKDAMDLEDKLLSEATTRSKSSNSTRVNLPFTRILTLGEVQVYLEEIAKAFPDLVTLVNAGKSFEGRDIWYLKISSSKFQDDSKPVVFLHSLLHAREWITLPATLYAIQKLVQDVSEQELLQTIDWIILPVANPDGYVFSHGENRFWRKNRANNFVGVCEGVDLNRNFDFQWGESSSSISCSDTFHGTAPFSEPETQAIRNIILEHQDRLELYLDIHSFGSMILFGHGDGVFPPNALILNLVGVQMAQAIDAVKASFNPNYVVGNVALVLYEVSGSSIDYAKAVGVPLAYTYELPGRRFGVGAFGFLVDPTFIEQAGMETFEGIKAGAIYARNSYRARKG